MFHIVLFRPEIPSNAGNAIRLAANTGAHLHFVEPLGFSMDDKQLKRAGLDYHELTQLTVHRDWNACRKALPARIFALSTKAGRSYAEVKYELGDAFVFGQETRGLPDAVLEAFAPEARRGTRSSRGGP